MGMNESTIKLITDPVNILIGNCGHSDCKAKCGNCFELEVDTLHVVNALPVLQAKDNSRDSMGSNVTKIVERPDAAMK